MKVAFRFFISGVFCFCLVQMVSPKKITVELLKTDQGSWEKPFSYAIESQTSKKSTSLPFGKGTPVLDIKTNVLTYKNIRKDTKISFDDSNDSNTLHVCTQPNGAGECATPFNLDNHNINLVIAIDKNGELKSMSKKEANDLIAASKPPTIHAVHVYKTGGNRDEWTIKAIKSDNGTPDEAIVYGQTAIRENTTGLAKKLKVPLNTEVFIVINNGTPQKLTSIGRNERLDIDNDGNVTIHGQIPETALQKQARELAEKEKEEKAAQEIERKKKELETKKSAEIAKKIAILQKQVRLRKSNLERVEKRQQLSAQDQMDGLELLAQNKHNRGEDNQAQAIVQILEDMKKEKFDSIGNRLNPQDKESLLKLLLEDRKRKLEEVELQLKALEEQGGPALVIHEPAMSASESAEASKPGLTGVHVKGSSQRKKD